MGVREDFNTEKEVASEEEITKGLINSFVRSAIGFGAIDIEGLSEEDANEKVVEYLQDFLKTGNDVGIITDHKDTLLEEARGFVQKKKNQLALMVFATWWEHWINGVLQSVLFKKGIVDKEFKQVITSLNNRAKTSWLLKLVDLPPFEIEHLEVMTKLAEKRNSFVHYKYPIDNETTEDMETFFKLIECSISYFIEYEDIYVYQSNRNFEL